MIEQFSLEKSRLLVRCIPGASTLAGLLMLTVLMTSQSGCEKQPTVSLGKTVELAQLLRLERRPEEALEVLERLAAEYPHLVNGKSPEQIEFQALRLDLAILLERTRDALKIVEDLERGLGELPASVRLQKARALTRMGEGEEAMGLFEASPDEELGRYFLEHGRALVAAERLEEAVRVLAGGLTVKPWDQEGYLEIGRVLARVGREEIAEALLERHRQEEPWREAEQRALALEKEKELGRAFHVRARAEQRRENLFQALLLENTALKVRPDLGEAMLSLARLSLFLQRPRETIEWLEKIPPHAPALEILAEAYRMDGQIEKATETYRRAAELAPEKQKSRLLELAKTADRPADDLEKARQEARKVLRNPSLSMGVGALEKLALDYHRLGETGDARKLAFFLLAYPRGRVEGARAVLAICDRPGDLFFRLQAARVLDEETGTGHLATELEPLGLEVDKFREHLESHFVEPPPLATPGPTPRG